MLNLHFPWPKATARLRLEMGYPWLETTGGPALLLERRFLSTWLGVLGASLPTERVRFRFGDPEAPATDYDRAAELHLGEVALLPVMAGDALLIGGDPGPLQARSDDDGLSLIRVTVSDGDEFIEPAIQELGDDRWESTGVTFRVRTPECVLFDSTLAGNDALRLGGLALSLRPGDYSVQTARLSNGHVEIVGHRLRPPP
jgi:hypothetical protein